MSVDAFNMSELIRVSALIKAKCGTPLIDFDYLRQAHDMKANPGKYNTRMDTPLPDGVNEFVVDIFKRKLSENRINDP